MLWEWRNDPDTRRQSISTEEVSWENHVKWFAATLVNPDRKLYVVEDVTVPVGTVRFDRDEATGRWEISWTVAPSARGQGIGGRLVAEAVAMFKSPLKAVIKPSNVASAKIAERAGFRKTGEDSQMTYWIHDLQT